MMLAQKTEWHRAWQREVRTANPEPGTVFSLGFGL